MIPYDGGSIGEFILDTVQRAISPSETNKRFVTTAGGYTPPFYTSGFDSGVFAPGNSGYATNVLFDLNLLVRTSHETRGASISVLFVISY